VSPLGPEDRAAYEQARMDLSNWIRAHVREGTDLAEVDRLLHAYMTAVGRMATQAAHDAAERAASIRRN
jgi:hypothetical protein